MKQGRKYINLLLTVLLSMLIGAVFMLLLGYNPLVAFQQLFLGAFVGRLNIGTTLQKFVPVLLTGIAFSVSARRKNTVRNDQRKTKSVKRRMEPPKMA